MRFTGDEGAFASALRRFEQTVVAVEDLAELVLEVECLACFDDVAEARMPAHRASGAGYIPARARLVINSAVFGTLDAPTQTAVLCHEVGHALRHRRGLTRPVGEDCFEADVLAIHWGVGDARLALGARGEKLYGARNFLELYAVFSTPRVLRVMHGPTEVGVVDASFLQDKDQKVPNFVLAGRPWHVNGVDWKGGTCSVEPAEAGGYPRWFGQPVSLERSLCQAMRRVLQGSENDTSWSKRAVTALESQRESHAFLSDAPLPLEEDPDGRCRWWTYGGGAGNRVLAGLLELELGARVSPGNTFITFAEGAAESSVAIRQAIDALAGRVPLGWADATRLVDPGQRSRVSKFQPCLPPEIEHGLIARETMSVADANTTLVEWTRGA